MDEIAVMYVMLCGLDGGDVAKAAMEMIRDGDVKQEHPVRARESVAKYFT